MLTLNFGRRFNNYIFSFITIYNFLSFACLKLKCFVETLKHFYKSIYTSILFQFDLFVYKNIHKFKINDNWHTVYVLHTLYIIFKLLKCKQKEIYNL